MLIDCPSCARSYHVSRAALGESGRNVVCQICDTRWYVEAPRAEMERNGRDDEPVETAGAGQSIVEETMVQEGLDHDEITPDASPHDEIVYDAFAPDEATRDEIAHDAIPHDEFSAEQWTDSFVAPPLGEIRATREDKPQKPAVPRRRIRRRPRSFKGLRQAAAIAACLALTMGLIGKRNEIVRILPGTGALYAVIGLPVNIRNLEFGAVTAARAEAGGSVVEVSGTIHNIAHRRVRVPRLTFEIRNAARAILASWSENAPKHSLASEETLAFTTKTGSLPDGYKDIAVHFSDEAPVNKLREIVAQAAR
jgi:predicted Zn finger-like uncharacterized protein